MTEIEFDFLLITYSLFVFGLKVSCEGLSPTLIVFSIFLLLKFIMLILSESLFATKSLVPFLFNAKPLGVSPPLKSSILSEVRKSFFF
jgi:hypothetical protein